MIRGGSSPEILGGGALPHHQPLHHRVHFLRSPKPKKYELHTGLHMKSIISRVANSVMGWTLRPVETRPEGPRAGVGFLLGAASSLPFSYGVWGTL